MVKISDSKQIYCPVKEDKDEVVTLGKDGTLVNDENIIEKFEWEIVKDFENEQPKHEQEEEKIEQSILSQLKIVKNGVKPVEDCDLLRIYEKIKLFNFDRFHTDDKMQEEVKEITELIDANLKKATD